MAVTNAMEKTHLSLHHIRKLLFAQLTELMNPVFNSGLPPSLAATDPSLNFHTKGIDIATAAYVSQLGLSGKPCVNTYPECGDAQSGSEVRKELVHLASFESHTTLQLPGFDLGARNN